MYYYSMKLHMVGQRRKGKIAFLKMIVLTSASENDLTVFKNECVLYLDGKQFLQTRFTVTSLSLVMAIRLKFLLYIRRLRTN